MIVLFTDLDGTLLDHHTYRPGPALPELRRLQAAGVLVVPATAKTPAELAWLADEFGLPGPYIAENGAAVVGAGVDRVLGLPYDEVRARLRDAAGAAGAEVAGFGDATVEDVMSWTGLDRPAAVRARQRRWSETFRLLSGDECALAAALAERGLTMARGARFRTALGRHDKGDAARLLLAVLGPDAVSWAVGDAANDFALLAAVRHPMLVRAHDGTWADLDLPDLLRLDGIGPAGWAQAARHILPP
ncbi:HAD-IIB family hydrolase [Rhizomonospora bruguierae]|uniref:HAD-IIB family hydrolase n=1 Tax=Rhizomonospora bruguierae TaxID=1581705 RepID=UPI001BCCFC82|nr:HAD-IIB family hydrolase [Micromonospora sp. NBRC 107566]